MTLFLDGLAAFATILVAFGILAGLYAAFEFVLRLLERRRIERELLPPPNPRAVVRRRGWQVPF